MLGLGHCALKEPNLYVCCVTELPSARYILTCTTLPGGDVITTRRREPDLTLHDAFLVGAPAKLGGHQRAGRVSQAARHGHLLHALAQRLLQEIRQPLVCLTRLLRLHGALSEARARLWQCLMFVTCVPGFSSAPFLATGSRRHDSVRLFPSPL